MRPYRTSAPRPVSCRVRLLCFLVGALVIACPVTSAAAEPRLKLAADPRIRAGLEAYYNLEYDRALKEFEKVQQANPDDPIAINQVLATLLFRELYRAGGFETGLYATNNFVNKRRVVISAEVAKQLRELGDRALRAAEQRLQKDPKDIEALYARGVTRGLRATQLALVDKAWFAALRNAIGAKNDHERVLELDPAFADAKTIVGVHNYVAGSLPWAIKVAVSVVGLTGSKQKGIRYLYEAADAGGWTSPDARVALVLFLRREQRYDEALKLARALAAEHPRNFLFAVEEGNILNAAGRGPEAIASLRNVIEGARQGRYSDPHLEVPLFSLGEALKGQRQYLEAARAYEEVPKYPRVDTDLKQRAYLYAGMMYDAAGERAPAQANYQQALAADPESDHARDARKYLKNPYRPR